MEKEERDRHRVGVLQDEDQDGEQRNHGDSQRRPDRAETCLPFARERPCRFLGSLRVGFAHWLISKLRSPAHTGPLVCQQPQALDVNGHLKVTGCGQLKVPTLRALSPA